MPPFGHLVRDTCWLEVATHPRPGKTHPEVVYIHCQKAWFSNSRIRVVEHLEDCKELPQRLQEQYQPKRLRPHEKRTNELNPPPSKKRKQDSCWMDKMEDSKAEVLNKLLAEFFYGAGIALSLVSSLFIQ